MFLMISFNTLPANEFIKILKLLYKPSNSVNFLLLISLLGTI